VHRLLEMVRMRTLLLIALLLMAMAATAVAQTERVLPIPNGGFEDGLTQWIIPEGEGMATLSTEQAAGGRCSLKIVDNDLRLGSNVRAARVAVSGPAAFELRGQVYPVWGAGLGIYVRVLDEDGRLLLPGDRCHRGLGGSSKQWEPFSLPVYATKQTAYLELWIHSYSGARVEAYLDDLHFVSLGSKGMRPPWEGQYKVRPHETDRLTPADVVGPDGIVYPNWTKCGVQGGIPHVGQSGSIEQFGARADDDLDDSVALGRACEAAGEAGGRAVLLGQGTYYLDRPVTVRHDNVVIRGQGADKTRLIFRYALPEPGAAFYTPASGARIGRGTRIELHCRPEGLMEMTIVADGVAIKEWKRSTHSGNTFACATSGRALIGKVPEGPHVLQGVGKYRNGSVSRCQIPVTVDSSFKDTQQVPSAGAAITFAGRGLTGPRIQLVRDGQRGDTALELADASSLAPGDCILIDGPATPRWKELTKNACRWGAYRRYQVRVDQVEGNTVRINQPLRIEFPTVDGSYVQKTIPIRNCGIEDLYIEQTENLWISTVIFGDAWNCWARGVTVRKCGRFPVYGSRAKWCEIRNCVFDDAWFKGGGGTAYAGWEHSWDCLMENCETFKLRHAPLFQWAASGNVIRKGVFHESDAQWHSGWTNENLMEQCVVTSVRGHGAYGYGMWASPPEDTAHGPNGPRNVVYNCDISSERDGLWMGGMNENWLILYSRFIVDKGSGVFARTASFDHVIRGNVFALRDEESPMVLLATPDCIGVEIIGNRLYGGNGELVAGIATPERVEGNETFPLQEPPRPQPAVPSIYEWQQAHAPAR